MPGALRSVSLVNATGDPERKRKMLPDEPSDLRFDRIDFASIAVGHEVAKPPSGRRNPCRTARIIRLSLISRRFPLVAGGGKA